MTGTASSEPGVVVRGALSVTQRGSVATSGSGGSRSNKEGGASPRTPAEGGTIDRMLQMRTLLVLYVTYALFYLPRKADSVVKSSLHEVEGFSLAAISFADTSYLLTYSCMLFVSGVIGSKFKSNKVLAVGLCGISACSFMKAHVTTSSNAYAALQVMHGVFQSAGWPTCIRLLSVWITENRGFIMGLWTTCQSLGGILGAVIATHYLGQGSIHGVWHWVYYYHVPLLPIWAVVVYFTIQDHPPMSVQKTSRWANADDIESSEGLLNPPAGSSKLRPRKAQTLPLKQVIAVPGVVGIAFAYFFLKFLRYALLLWLPYYFHEGLGFEKRLSGYISTSFEVGGLIGTPLIGRVMDKMMNGNGARASATFLALASGFLLCDELFARSGVVFNALMMVCIGILVIGPDSILSGTIAQTIGKRSGLDSKAVGIIAGFINSVGSAGSILQSPATAFISNAYGWNTLFLVFVFCSVTCSAILFRASSAQQD